MSSDIILDVEVTTVTLDVTVTNPTPVLEVEVLPGVRGGAGGGGVPLLSDMLQLASVVKVVNCGGRNTVGDPYHGVFEVVEGDFTDAVSIDTHMAIYVPIPGVEPSTACRVRRTTFFCSLEWLDLDLTGDTDETAALNAHATLCLFTDLEAWSEDSSTVLFGSDGVTCANYDYIPRGRMLADIQRGGTVGTRASDGTWTLTVESQARFLLGGLAGGGTIPPNWHLRVHDALVYQNHRFSGAAGTVPWCIQVSGFKDYKLYADTDALLHYGDGHRDNTHDSNAYGEWCGRVYRHAYDGRMGVKVDGSGKNNGWNNQNKCAYAHCNDHTSTGAYTGNENECHMDGEGTLFNIDILNGANNKYWIRGEAISDGSIKFRDPSGIVFDGTVNSMYTKQATKPTNSTPALVNGDWYNRTVVLTGTLTNGTPNVTGLANTTNLAVGQTVTGTNVGGGATVVSFDANALTAVLSVNSTGDISTPLTFADPTRVLTEGDWAFVGSGTAWVWWIYTAGDWADNSTDTYTPRRGAMNNYVEIADSQANASFSIHQTDWHAKYAGVNLGSGNRIVHGGTIGLARVLVAEYKSSQLMQTVSSSATAEASQTQAHAWGWRKPACSRKSDGIVFTTASQEIIATAWHKVKHGMVYVFWIDAAGQCGKPTLNIRNAADWSIPTTFPYLRGGSGIRYASGTVSLSTTTSNVQGLYALEYTGPDDAYYIQAAIRSPTITAPATTSPICRHLSITMTGLPLQWAHYLEEARVKDNEPDFTASTLAYAGNKGDSAYDGTSWKKCVWREVRSTSTQINAGTTANTALHWTDALTGGLVGDRVSFQMPPVTAAGTDYTGKWFHAVLTNTPGTTNATIAMPSGGMPVDLPINTPIVFTRFL